MPKRRHKTKTAGGGTVGDDGDVHLKKGAGQKLAAFLPSLTKIELIVTYLQLLGLLLLVDVGWPKEVTDATDWVNFVVWDIRKPNIGVVEFRAHFLVIVCLFPLLFTFFMLLFLQSFAVVLWYFILLGSLTCFAAGFTVKLLPSNEFTRTTPSDYFFYAGLLGLVFVLVSYVAYKIYLKRRVTRLKKDFPGASQEEREYADWRRKEEKRREPRPWWQLLIELLLIVACVLIGLAAVGTLSFRANEKASLSGPLKALIIAFGQGLIVIAVLLFIHLVLVLFPWGRDFLAGLLNVLRDHFVRFMLFILSIGYIPASNMTLAVFNCYEASCPPGQTYPNKDILLSNFARDGFTSRAKTDMCEPCRYRETCPEDFFFCDEAKDWRLGVDPSLSCRTHMWPYYHFAGFFMGLALVAGIPWLYRRVTKDSASALNATPLPTESSDTPGVSWYLRTAVSKNTANRLYSPFSLNSRYYRLVIIFFKLAAVILALFLVQYPGAAILSLTSTYLLATLVSLWKRAYINPVDDWLGIALGLNNTINGLLGLGVWQGMDMPAYSVALVFILNIALPVLALFLGTIASARLSSKAKSLKEKKDRNQVTKQTSERVLIRYAKLFRVPVFKEYYAKFQKENRLLMIREAQLAQKKKAKRDAKRAKKYGDAAPEEKQNLRDGNGKAPAGIPPLVSKNQGSDPNAAPPPGPGESTLFRGANAAAHIKLAKNFQRSDIHLDMMSMKTLTQFFTVLGTIAFISLMVVLVGIVYSSVTTTFVPHEPTIIDNDPNFITNHEFALNDDWEFFVEDCCCGVGEPSEDYLVTEIWQCLNGFYKQKVRQQLKDGVVHDGLLIRKLCAKTFEPGLCEPYYEDTQQTVTSLNFYKTEVCQPLKYNASLPLPTDYALRRLW